MTVNRDRSSVARPVRRGVIAGLLVLVAVLLGNSSAQAAVTIAGGLGGEILTNPVPGPVVAAPNIFPVPPPVSREPGFVPAPAPPGPLTFPVPEPSNGVNDGPGSRPADVPRVQIDADTSPADAGKAGDPVPVGKLTRVDDKFLKRKGIDAHEEKEGVGLTPASRFDIYVDRKGNMFGVAKGLDPKLGTYIRTLPR